MSPISHQMLETVPYLDVSNLHGRSVILMPLWDGEHWRVWFPLPDRIMETKIVDAVEIDYVAKEPASADDLLFPFVEFLWQRACFPEVEHFIKAIGDDFHNMGTALAKLRHFHRMRSQLAHPIARRFIATELEYFLVLARSVFDLLQEALARLWNDRFRLTDDAADLLKRTHKLPASFSKIVRVNDGVFRTAGQIEERYAIPPVVAQAYEKSASFFAALRASRDAIVHGGASLHDFYVTEKGICVARDAKPFTTFAGWRQVSDGQEALVSIVPWLAEIVWRTVETCNGIVFSFASVLLFPPDVAPGYRIFSRGPCNSALSEVVRVREGGGVWWSDSDVGP